MKQIGKKYFPFLLALFFLIFSVLGSMWWAGTQAKASSENKKEEAAKTLPQTQYFENQTEEMRAVWVPFLTLDLKGSSEKGEEAFQKKFDEIVKGAKKCGMNTLIVHVRSHADAMYPSSLFPWSHLISGTQGNDSGFDPLSYMVSASHEAGLAFHAWINPLRIQVNSVPNLLSPQNYYNLWREDEDSCNDHWVMDDGADKYFNPAYPEVRALIISGVREIVSRYAVDGIHFDDYFYPSSAEIPDQTSYEEYCASLQEGAEALSLAEWRKSNINLLISGVYSAVKTENADVLFGVSPQGNFANDNTLGADVASWGSRQGYVDYLCPQIYVNFDHPLLPFDRTVQDWRELVSCEKVKLYIGLGVYKAGSDADNGSWQTSGDILQREIEYAREAGADGFMLYSWDYLNNPQTSEEISNVMKVFN